MTYVFDETTTWQDLFESIPSATRYWAIAEWEVEGESIRLTDNEDADESWVVDVAVMKRGLPLALKNIHPVYQKQALADLLAGDWENVDWDIDTVDFLVQFGLFGELVYG